MQNGQALWLDEGPEVVLSTVSNSASYKAEVSKGNRLTLPDSILDRLGVETKSLIGLVQRPNALALKKLEIVEREATQARLYDRETAATITRCVETNPMPDERLPKLVEQHAHKEHQGGGPAQHPIPRHRPSGIA